MEPPTSISARPVLRQVIFVHGIADVVGYKGWGGNAIVSSINIDPVVQHKVSVAGEDVGQACRAHIPEDAGHDVTNPQHDGHKEAETGADGVCIQLRLLQAQKQR